MPINSSYQILLNRFVNDTCTISGNFIIPHDGILVLGLSAVNYGYDNNCGITLNGNPINSYSALGSQGYNGSVARIYVFEVKENDSIAYHTGGPAYLPSAASCYAWLF